MVLFIHLLFFSIFADFIQPVQGKYGQILEHYDFQLNHCSLVNFLIIDIQNEDLCKKRREYIG